MEDKMQSILVVDDHSSNLQVLSTVLRNKYKLFFALDAEKALEILETVKPDLVLLDIMMPNIDGFELCTIIKSKKHLSEIPIIFLTARTDINDIVKGFDLGAADYVTKPFNIKELNKRIENQLRLIIAMNEINQQKNELISLNIELSTAKEQVQLRNEDLLITQEAIEEHAYQVNLLNQQLLESEYKLKKLNEDLKSINKQKDRFFSIISHDLKSPFNSLLGLLKMMDDNIEDFSQEELKEVTAGLYNSAKGVYNLLENLLEWSLSQLNRIEVNQIEISMNEVIEDINSSLSKNAIEKQIRLINKTNKEVYAFADSNMISSVLRNLISNSIKFSNKGSEIEISCVDDGKEIVCQVKDQGVGISGEVKEKLFKIDENVSNLGTNQEKGTGLGLILCKDFVEKNQGRIWVESEVGKGTTFFFTLTKAL